MIFPHKLYFSFVSDVDVIIKDVVKDRLLVGYINKILQHTGMPFNTNTNLV